MQFFDINNKFCSFCHPPTASHLLPISPPFCPLLIWKSPINWRLHLHISDQRVRGWLLLDNYLPTLALTVTYLLIVWTGPKYMKTRQPYSCRGILMLYNLGLTLLSFYMFYEVNRLLRAVTKDYKRTKERAAYSLRTECMNMARNMYI